MSKEPYQITIVSHTHWDREWYRPFQIFRFQLVELVDRLLEILANHPDYQSFLLDGQTIILEDYLAIRPEREAELKHHIQNGRLSIGPWHILPDEFLVSPESTVRNLMLGAKVATRFGERMTVGYTPDPFGHISQLPQIMKQCGLDAVALQRGLADEPTELWWQGPDGTRVLTIYFRTGYGNLAWAPTNPDAFTRAVERQLEQLAPYAQSPYILLLNGTDHMMPQAELPGLIAQANERLRGRAHLVHGTLPDYVEKVRQAVSGRDDIPVICGELRSSKRSPLLPGVYSARMWIKQTNHACEVALERYAEPLAAFAQWLGGPDRHGELWQAWRYLIENHPHDSICGCSVDEVHEEMRTRFAWSRQIADQITEAALRYILRQIDPLYRPQYPAEENPSNASISVDASVRDHDILVFNPVTTPQTGVVEVAVPWAGPNSAYTLLDDQGKAVAYRVLEGDEAIFESRQITRDELLELLEVVEVGFYKGRLINSVSLSFEGDQARLEMILPEYHTGQIGDFVRFVRQARLDPRLDTVKSCHLVTYLSGDFRLAFVARDVPGIGYKTYYLQRTLRAKETPAQSDAAPSIGHSVENEWFSVAADATNGTLVVTDKITGQVYTGLNRLQDGGDRGDEYNYCSPENDMVITDPVDAPHINVVRDHVLGDTLVIQAEYAIPTDLSPNRMSRSHDKVMMPVTIRVKLVPGVRRIDLRVDLENHARNHRLRVLFPTNLDAHSTFVDGHFDLLEWVAPSVAGSEDWAEKPQPTRAQRYFTALEEEGHGLLVAARGLPEIETFATDAGACLALTLLRSVGWLSRDDLSCRHGHAGPERPTPGAQCQGPATFEYSLIPYGGLGFGLPEAALEAQAYIAPLIATAGTCAGTELPSSHIFLSLEPANLVLTALKPGENGSDFVIRFYNSAKEKIQGRLKFGFEVERVTPVNLLEQTTGKPLTVTSGNSVTLEVASKSIVSLAVKAVGTKKSVRTSFFD